MAITFKKEPSYSLSMLALFDVDPTMLAQAGKIGVEVKQTGLGMFGVYLDGVSYGSVPVKGQALSLAKAGSLGPSSKQQLKVQFEQCLTKALAAHQAVNPGPLIAPTPASPVKAPAFKLPGSMSAKPATASSLVDASDLLKQAKETVLLPPVVLGVADRLFQPVSGSSPGSVYYVFLLSGQLKMAARYKGANLSVRAVGYTDSQKQALVDSKFDAHSSYCSAHFKVPSPELVYKTLGALFGAVGGVGEVAPPPIFLAAHP